MHNAHLQFDGKKLAKRAGQQFTLDSLREQGHSPITFRWLVLTSHYRSKIDFTWERMAEAKVNLDSVRALLSRIWELTEGEVEGGGRDENIISDFKKGLADDLNTPQAFAVVQQYINAANKKIDQIDAASSTDEQGDMLREIYATLMDMDQVIGVFSVLQQEVMAVKIPEDVQRLSQEREMARAKHDFEKADQLKEKIEQLGWSVQDKKSGVRLVRDSS